MHVGACLEALRLITNHAGDSSRESWLQWYSANRRGTRIQWWADGFAAEGYPVSMAGGEASVKNFLSLLGRAAEGQQDAKPWLSRNAERMLARSDQKEVGRVIGEVSHSGSQQQRRGAAHYAEFLDKMHRLAMPPATP